MVRFDAPENDVMVKLTPLLPATDAPVRRITSPTRKPTATGSPPPAIKVEVVASAARLVNAASVVEVAVMSQVPRNAASNSIS